MIKPIEHKEINLNTELYFVRQEKEVSALSFGPINWPDCRELNIPPDLCYLVVKCRQNENNHVNIVIEESDLPEKVTLWHIKELTGMEPGSISAIFILENLLGVRFIEPVKIEDLSENLLAIESTSATIIKHTSFGRNIKSCSIRGMKLFVNTIKPEKDFITNICNTSMVSEMIFCKLIDIKTF